MTERPDNTGTNWVADMSAPVLFIEPAIPTDRPLHADCRVGINTTTPAATASAASHYSDPQVELVRRIQQCVAQSYGVTIYDILGENRLANIVEARHVSIWLCNQLTRLDAGEITLLHNRERSLNTHAVKTVIHRSTLDRRFGARLQGLLSIARTLRKP